MSKDLVEYINHIAVECSYIISVSKDLSKDAFLKDETLNAQLPEV